MAKKATAKSATKVASVLPHAECSLMSGNSPKRLSSVKKSAEGMDSNRLAHL